MKKLLTILAIILCAANIASARTESSLKRHFEGRHVTLKIDVPATKDGLSIYPERPRSLDYDEYAASLKRHGAALRAGEAITITGVRIRGRHVEVRLGVARFNVHYDLTDTDVLTPEALTEALEKYVNFPGAEESGAPATRSTSYRRQGEDAPETRVLRVGPRTTYLSNGLSVREVEMLLGKPSSVSERRDRGATIATMMFHRAEERVVVAVFVNGILIRSRIETFRNLALSK